MKRCTQCGQLKEESEFWRVRRNEVPGQEVLRARCRDCASQDPRDHSDDEKPDGKTCTACGEWKPLAEFHKHKICRYGVESICKRCKFKKRKERDARDPNRVRRMDLRAKYGITIEQYQEMRVRQDGRCAICGMEAGEKGEKLVVDHNHQTGQVRGLLCHLCNAMIGCARESLEILAAASAYLYAEQHPEAGPVRVEVRYVPAAPLLAVVPAGG